MPVILVKNNTKLIILSFRTTFSKTNRNMAEMLNQLVKHFKPSC